MSNNCERRSAGRRTNTALAAALLAGSGFVFAVPAQATPFGYNQIDLVTDNQAYLTSQGFGAAATVDPNLVNPWGISHSPTSPFWLSDQGTNVSTLYNGAGVRTALVESVSGGPTGQVFNGTAADFIANGASANFIFATLSGTIQARSGATGTTALVEHATPGAVYTGLAIGNNGSNHLYAANFSQGTIDVFDRTFAPVTLAGSFVDPNLPAGYTPYNTQTLGSSLYVTYTQADSVTHRATTTPGIGIVAEFDLSGHFIRDVVEPGLLDSPWGVDIAPAGFGQYANDLLIGNFGSGMIDVFDPNNFNADGTDLYLGTINNALGNPLVIPGLWALSNGPASGTNPNYVYFSAGIGNEAHGLFGALAPAPEPASLALVGGGLAGMAGMSAMRRRRKAVA